MPQGIGGQRPADSDHDYQQHERCQPGPNHFTSLGVAVDFGKNICKQSDQWKQNQAACKRKLSNTDDFAVQDVRYQKRGCKEAGEEIRERGVSRVLTGHTVLNLILNVSAKS